MKFIADLEPNGFWMLVLSSLLYVSSHEPETDSSPAIAETDTNEPAKADAPIFVNLFIITPFLFVNN